MQASATIPPNLYGAWAGLRKCRHPPLCHQIRTEPGQVSVIAPYYMIESSSLLYAVQPPGRKRTQDINHDLGQQIQALALATLPAEFKIAQTMAAAISEISQPSVFR